MPVMEFNTVRNDLQQGMCMTITLSLAHWHHNVCADGARMRAKAVTVIVMMSWVTVAVLVSEFKLKTQLSVFVCHDNANHCDMHSCSVS